MQDQTHTFTWKLKKSAWVLLSFFGLAWLGISYAGKKAQNQRWRIAGGVYAVLQIGTFLACLCISSQSALYDKMVDLWAAVYFLGVIHSFIILRMYLKCISGEGAAVSPAAPYSTKITRPEADAFRPEPTDSLSPSPTPAPAAEPQSENVAATAPAPAAAPQPETAAAPAPAPVAEPQLKTAAAPAEANPHVVHVNTCNVSDFKTLPGMTPDRIERVLQYREENGGFLSAEEFIAAADIPLQDEETVRGRIYC